MGKKSQCCLYYVRRYQYNFERNIICKDRLTYKLQRTSQGLKSTF
jgi:hypothetical protein